MASNADDKVGWASFKAVPNTEDEELIKARRVARFAVARSDIEHAHRLCDYAETVELIKGHPLSLALQEAVIVSYARPFLHSRLSGKLAKRWSRFDDPHLQEMHQRVIKLRNSIVAHADQSYRRVSFYGAQVRLPNGIVVTEPKVGVDRAWLEPSSYRAIRNLCLDLEPRLTAAFNEAFLDWVPGGMLPGSSFQLALPPPPPKGAKMEANLFKWCENTLEEAMRGSGVTIRAMASGGAVRPTDAESWDLLVRALAALADCTLALAERVDALTLTQDDS